MFIAILKKNDIDGVKMETEIYQRISTNATKKMTIKPRLKIFLLFILNSLCLKSRLLKKPK